MDTIACSNDNVKDFIELLSKDLFFEIFNNLALTDLGRAAQVSKTWNTKISAYRTHIYNKVSQHTTFFAATRSDPRGKEIAVKELLDYVAQNDNAFVRIALRTRALKDKQFNDFLIHTPQLDPNGDTAESFAPQQVRYDFITLQHLYLKFMLKLFQSFEKKERSCELFQYALWLFDLLIILNPAKLELASDEYSLRLYGLACLIQSAEVNLQRSVTAKEVQKYLQERGYAIDIEDYKLAKKSITQLDYYYREVEQRINKVVPVFNPYELACNYFNKTIAKAVNIYEFFPKTLEKPRAQKSIESRMNHCLVYFGSLTFSSKTIALATLAAVRACWLNTNDSAEIWPEYYETKLSCAFETIKDMYMLICQIDRKIALSYCHRSRVEEEREIMIKEIQAPYRIPYYQLIKRLKEMNTINEKKRVGQAQRLTL